MTKEELEKEATEFEENYTVYEVAKRKDGSDYAKKVCRVTVKEAYLASAEPREKRIAELEKENKVLTQNLEDSEIIIAGLKAQIEKMKNCKNCGNNHDCQLKGCKCNNHIGYPFWKELAND